MIVIPRNRKRSSAEEQRFLQGEAKHLFSIRMVELQKVAGDREGIGVFIFQPTQGRARENDCFPVSDMQIGEESQPVAAQRFGPAWQP